MRTRTALLLRPLFAAAVAAGITYLSGLVTLPAFLLAQQQSGSPQAFIDSLRAEETLRWRLLTLSTGAAVLLTGVILEIRPRRFRWVLWPSLGILSLLALLFVGPIGGTWPEWVQTRDHPGIISCAPTWVRYWALWVGLPVLALLHIASAIRARA